MICLHKHVVITLYIHEWVPKHQDQFISIHLQEVEAHRYQAHRYAILEGLFFHQGGYHQKVWQASLRMVQSGQNERQAVLILYFNPLQSMWMHMQVIKKKYLGKGWGPPNKPDGSSKLLPPRFPNIGWSGPTNMPPPDLRTQMDQLKTTRQWLSASIFTQAYVSLRQLLVMDLNLIHQHQDR